MNTKTLTILALAAVAAVAAAVVVTRSDKTVAAPGTIGAPSGGAGGAPSLFPGLASRVEDVAAITVKSGQGESNIELTDGQWRLKEKADYPVDAAKVREVVLSLAALRNFQQRTTRADLFKSLGVDDVAATATPKVEDPAADPAAQPQPEAPRSLLMTLKDKTGQPIASVIVGNTKFAQSPAPQGIYLRKPGEPTSWYAEGKLEVPREPLTWVNNEFADIGRDRVRSVVVMPGGGVPESDRISVAREKPAEGAFVVQAIPEGKQLKDTSLSETVVAGLVKSAFEDVAKAETIDFAAPAAAVDVRTWDGLVVHVDTVESAGRQWWKLTASADPDPFMEAATPPPATDTAAAPPPPQPVPAEPKPKRTPEEVKKEVDELNARWTGWAFSPYSYKATAFSKKLSDELKDPAPPEPLPAAPGSGMPPDMMPDGKP